MHKRPPQLTKENALKYQQADVAAHYPLRQPYPEALFDILNDLIADTPRTVLDIGTGTGDLARHLVPYADHIDAIDISQQMMNIGQKRENGDHPKINWRQASAETWQSDNLYALMVSGEAFHWLDWETVLPHLAGMLSENGMLAIVGRNDLQAPWHQAMMEVVIRYSTLKDYEHYDMQDELVKLGLFHPIGSQTTVPVTVTQALDDYIASFHSRASLTRNDLGPHQSQRFAEDMKSVVEPFAISGMLSWNIAATVFWGKPLHTPTETP